MGWFGEQQTTRVEKTPSTELLHKLECRVCPLNRDDTYHRERAAECPHNRHMPASGVEHPTVYILGEAPGRDEDHDGKRQFIGKSGKLLRERIPTAWFKRIRFNNVVRTRPPENRDPTFVEIEACRPSVTKDIAASKPRAIFGFGIIPLEWVGVKGGQISDWRGRRLPVNIGGHTCWYYPMFHPAFVLRRRGDKADHLRPTDIGSEDERAYVFDLERAFAEMDDPTFNWDPVVHTAEQAIANIEVLQGDPGDINRLEDLLGCAGTKDLAGVDYETKGVRPYAADAKICTAAVSTDDATFAFAMDHREARWSRSERKRVDELWIRFLESKCRKAVHFLGFEQEWTAVKYRPTLLRASRWESTESQAVVIDERTGENSSGEHRQKQGPLSLSFLVRQYFGFDLKALGDVNVKNIDGEPLIKVLRYNAPDARYHRNLFLAQDREIKRYGFEKQYEEMRRRVPTCVHSQIKGAPINIKVSHELDKKYEEQVRVAKQQIAEEPAVIAFEKKYGQKFKPTSDDDNVMMFRDFLKRDEGKTIDRYTKKEKYKVDEDNLQKIDHPLVPLILKMRKAAKRQSTYIYHSDVWPDGLLHPNFNTVFARTKRLSCDGPNLQNIIKRDQEGKEVRLQLEAPPGMIFGAFDYGQIQARGIAMHSRDKNFCQALWERFDVHGDYAEKVAYAYPARVGGREFLKDKKALKLLRDDIKNEWTFPLFFGAQEEFVAQILKVPHDALKPVFGDFWKTFSGVRDWQERLLDDYNKKGYVEDLFGFRHHAPLSRNQVLNSPIQSLEPVFVMDGMNRLSEHAEQTQDWNYQPNLQIHDDLEFLLPVDELDIYSEKIISEMTKVKHFKFCNVPITIEMSTGPNLFKMTPIVDVSSDGKWVWKEQKAA